ncbi:TIGR02391 family protein [Rhodococcus opacus]|uniref:TIGR02391 family protein n=1 Tax=Rhodococcus opacus TaxID=37919 RepID=UPI001B8013C7
MVASTRCPSSWPNCFCEKFNSSTTTGHFAVTTHPRTRPDRCIQAKSLNQLATGLNLTVRNVTTHTRDELSEQEGTERLAAYSYLARLLDRCEVRDHDRSAES